jgi:hypothetical protein
MTGRYLIYTPAESSRDERRFDRAWGRFAELCRSLHRDGIVRLSVESSDSRVTHSTTPSCV